MANAGLIDLLGGAVVDRQFRSTLIRDPQAVLGTFDLTLEECEAVCSIRALNFEDFAAQLYAWMVGQGNGYGTIRGHEEPCLAGLRPVSVMRVAGALPS
jgi:hypothetical protein